MSDKLIDPNAAVDYMIAKAAEFAQAKANRIYCEEYRKTLKSELMKEAMLKYDAANAQEREAYAHPEYVALLNGLAAAIEQEETLKWGMEAARMRCDIWRTEQANERMLGKATE